MPVCGGGNSMSAEETELGQQSHRLHSPTRFCIFPIYDGSINFPTSRPFIHLNIQLDGRFGGKIETLLTWFISLISKIKRSKSGCVNAHLVLLWPQPIWSHPIPVLRSGRCSKIKQHWIKTSLIRPFVPHLARRLQTPFTSSVEVLISFYFSSQDNFTFYDRFYGNMYTFMSCILPSSVHSSEHSACCAPLCGPAKVGLFRCINYPFSKSLLQQFVSPSPAPINLSDRIIRFSASFPRSINISSPSTFAAALM